MSALRKDGDISKLCTKFRAFLARQFRGSYSELYVASRPESLTLLTKSKSSLGREDGCLQDFIFIVKHDECTSAVWSILNDMPLISYLGNILERRASCIRNVLLVKKVLVESRKLHLLVVITML
jgi:hypothetical protein